MLEGSGLVVLDLVRVEAAVVGDDAFVQAEEVAVSDVDLQPRGVGRAAGGGVQFD